MSLSKRLLTSASPGGLPLHETFTVASQGALDISSVAGHPFLVTDYFSSPRVVAKPYQCDEGFRTSPQKPQYPNLYRRLKHMFGRSLRAKIFGQTGIKGYT